MALKPDRIELLTDVSFFMNTVAERGGVVSVFSEGVGASMDDSELLGVVELPDSCVKFERIDLPVACNGIAKGGSESLEVFGFEFHE